MHFVTRYISTGVLEILKRMIQNLLVEQYACKNIVVGITNRLPYCINRLLFLPDCDSTSLSKYVLGS